MYKYINIIIINNYNYKYLYIIHKFAKCLQTLAKCLQTLAKCLQTLAKCLQTPAKCLQTLAKCQQTLAKCNNYQKTIYYNNGLLIYQYFYNLCILYKYFAICTGTKQNSYHQSHRHGKKTFFSEVLIYLGMGFKYELLTPSSLREPSV